MESAMQIYDFTLIFALPNGADEPDLFIDALFEEECDDAILGVGRRGSIALDFSREASCADDAVKSAVDAVGRAIPGAKLIEVKPDLVNLSDIAEVVGCTRQNIQKYAAGEIKGSRSDFPLAVISGSQNFWCLYDVAKWLNAHANLQPASNVMEVARVASSFNLQVQIDRVGKHTATVTTALRPPNVLPFAQPQRPRSDVVNPFRALRADVVLTEHQTNFEPAVCEVR